jgi:peptidoglycan/LPS O-acetylase OafA/YrhL
MVDLFFILSGFIFLSTYGEKINNRTISVKKFFVLRFSRLYPLHWLMLLVVIIVKFLRKMSIGTGFFVYDNNNLFTFLQNLLLIQNGWLQTDSSFNGPAWSIPVEILMYIIFFAVFYYAKNKKAYIVTCLALIYYGLIMYCSGWNNSLFNGQIARGLIGFFIGCITAEVYKYCISNSKKGNWFIGFCAVSLAFLTVIPAIFGYDILKNWILVYIFAFFPALLLIVLRVDIISKIFSRIFF